MDSMLMELQNKNDKSIDKLLLDAESIVTKKSNDNYGLDEQENFSNLLEILGNSTSWSIENELKSI